MTLWCHCCVYMCMALLEPLSLCITMPSYVILLWVIWDKTRTSLCLISLGWRTHSLVLWKAISLFHLNLFNLWDSWNIPSQKQHMFSPDWWNTHLFALYHLICSMTCDLTHSSHTVWHIWSPTTILSSMTCNLPQPYHTVWHVISHIHLIQYDTCAFISYSMTHVISHNHIIQYDMWSATTILYGMAHVISHNHIIQYDRCDMTFISYSMTHVISHNYIIQYDTCDLTQSYTV